MHALRAALVALTLLASGTAEAGLTRDDIARARFTERIGEALPQDVVLREVDGTPRDIGTLLGGKPALVLFLDYTCTTLCGVAVSALADALTHVPFRQDADYRVLVVGFNPADGLAQAAAFRDAHVGATGFAAKAHFLSGTPEAVGRITAAAGLAAPYDAEHRQFAHPFGVLLVTPAGRIARYLDPLALTPFDLRLALAEADDGRFVTAADRLALLCYGWDAVTGVHTLAIRRILAAACLLTAFTVAAAVAFGFWRERRSLELSRE